MRALILAGGLGTRLRSALPDQPKSMAPVLGRPFLEYQLDLLKRSGVDDIVLCIGYMSEKIKEHFGDGSRFGLKVHYSEEKEPLGTAGAILNAAHFLTDNSIVLNGDTYFACDIRQLIDRHASVKAVITLALHPAPKDNRYGKVKLQSEGRVICFAEKDRDLPDESVEPVISGGTYVFNPKVLDLIPGGRSSSLELEVFPQAIQSGLPVYGVVDRGYFKDIGTPDSWEQFADDIISHRDREKGSA